MNAKSFKWGLVVVALAAAIYNLVPTVLDGADGELDRNVEKFDGKFVEWVMETGTPLTLGLDLQGGLLLQYKVLVEQAIQDDLGQTARDIEKRLASGEESAEVNVEHPEDSYRLIVNFEDPSKTSSIDQDFMSRYPAFQKKTLGSDQIRLKMTDKQIDKTRTDSVEQAIETIRQRVNSLGVTEPSITRKGKSNIVVQLPGLKQDDVARAKELIGQTAKLRFRLVDDDGTNEFFKQFKGNLPKGFKLRRVDGGQYLSLTHNSKKTLKEFLKDKVDEDHVIGYKKVRITNAEGEVNEEASYWKTYYIYRETRLEGSHVQNARVRRDRKFNKPYVSLNFDTEGGEKFGELSKNNVGKRMAIMLDEDVRSAPVFQEAIMGGRARITMGTMESFETMQNEARNLVIVLRHGALAAPIEMQYETVVGPTLGNSSINASSRALIVAVILIILFMLVYFRGSGFVSVMALLFNMIFILSGLAALGATLTLPGIAGIILTVGMAVDANVIIFERIREGVRAGQRPKEAVENGFDKAWSAVIDANITTGIAALVLMQYGTGPVRGFAVTLLIGIISTLFTAVFISRLVFQAWLKSSKPKELSI